MRQYFGVYKPSTAPFNGIYLGVLYYICGKIEFAMRKFLGLLAAVCAVAACVAGCSRDEGRIFPFGWERVGEPFDSMTETLEWMYLDGKPIDSIAAAVDRLRDAADTDVKRARATYWQARTCMRQDDYDRAMALFDSAASLAGAYSDKYPYDLARIRWNAEPDYMPLTVELYDKLSADISVFERERDYPLAAAKCMEMGMMFTDLGAVSESWVWLDRADSLFRIAGLEDNVLKNTINRAKNYQLEGDAAGSERLLRELVANPMIDRDPYARDAAFNNLYAMHGDTAALRRAYGWVRTIDRLGELQGLYESFLAEEALKNGDSDSARVYIARAASHLADMEDPSYVRDYYRCRAMVMDSLGMVDSAYASFMRYAALTDTMYRQRQTDGVMRAEVLKQIGERRLEAENERRRHATAFLVTVIVLIVVGGSAGAVMYRRLQRQRLGEARAALALEQSRRRVMAMQLAMDENARVVDAVGEAVTAMAAAGELPGASAIRLESVLKSHNGLKREQENFLTLFAEINPDFVPELKTRCPGLSDADVRMAIYIALGLDNKHIARLAGIRPESVKQARWRLKTKIGEAEFARLETAAASGDYR